MVTPLSKKNFDESVLKKGGRAAVKFWSATCLPCKQLAPIYEQLSNELEDLIFYEVNTSEEPGLVSDYRIMGVPTVILFENGEIIRRKTGMQSKRELRDFLQ